jgi:hypothetical protein
LGLAGGVVLNFGDSLEVQSDTLVWAAHSRCVDRSECRRARAGA